MQKVGAKHQPLHRSFYTILTIMYIATKLVSSITSLFYLRTHPLETALLLIKDLLIP